VSEIAPRRQIRRFDIFTEWNRLKAREKMQLPEKDARVYGLAVAKVVAGRGGGSFGRKPSTPHDKTHLQNAKKKLREDDHSDEWWRDFGSDEEFDDKIIHRMGESFYRHVFAPAVREAWDDGQEYSDVRDRMRQAWNETLKAKTAR
jgi:hypothetical protein